MCAGLNNLHSVKHILNKEECRSVKNAGLWWDDELAVAIAVKPPSVVQETLGVLKEYAWYRFAAKRIKSKQFHMTACVSMLVT